MNTVLTNYTDCCLICGKPNAEAHHLCFNKANRQWSEKFGLVIPVCRYCHNEIHNHRSSMILSKMLGQMAYEKNYGSREEFREIFGESYL